MAQLSKIWRGTVKSGRFVPDDKRFSQAFYPHESKHVEVVVRRAKKTRSVLQNGYMWTVVYGLIADNAGYSADDIHNLMRMKFWNIHIGDEVVPKSTKNMSTIEIEDYLSKCRMWASEILNLYIPLPNEVEIN